MKNRTRMKRREEKKRKRGKGTAADSPAVTCSELHPEAVSAAYAQRASWKATEQTGIGAGTVLVASSGVHEEGLQRLRWYGTGTMRTETERGIAFCSCKTKTAPTESSHKPRTNNTMQHVRSPLTE